MRYRDLDAASQIAEVNTLIPGILAHYGLRPAAVENVNHSHNSTFKITTDTGRQLSVRLNLGSGKSHNEVLAEMQWLQALAEDGSVLAPQPVPTTAGELLTTAYFPPLDIELTAVVFDWIDGDVVGYAATDEQLFELGAAMARLHTFAAHLAFAPPASLPTINRPLLATTDNLRPSRSPQVSDSLYPKLLEGLELAEAAFERVSLDQQLLPIHGDLHTFNVLQTTDRLAVIDFDDAGIGVPVQDLATSNYHLREDTEREKHLFAGFASVRELPRISAEDYELLLVGRLILLVNGILGSTSAELVGFVPLFLDRAERTLDHFFATGQLRLMA